MRKFTAIHEVEGEKTIMKNKETLLKDFQQSETNEHMNILNIEKKKVEGNERTRKISQGFEFHT